MNIEPIDEMEGEGDRDAQAVPLLNATRFGAMYLALGRQPIGMPFNRHAILCGAQPHARRRGALPDA